MPSIQEKLKPIKLIVLDVDGVLSDGSIVYGGNELEIKAFNVQDGFGITLARQAGLKLGILTGRISPPVKKRAAELKFDFYEEGHFQKEAALLQMMKQARARSFETLYMGDDILDLVCAKHVGVFVAPKNARKRVKENADWVTQCTGGNGAVRELIETVLDSQNILKVTEDYFMTGV